MRFSYRLIQEKSGYVAECVESEAVGEGKTKDAAVSSLREMLKERMFRPDAVAPPSDPIGGTIELVLAEGGGSSLVQGSVHPNEKKTIDFGGPGEAAPPRAR